MKSSFSSTCERSHFSSDFSFLFTLEEFARELLFLLGTVNDVSGGTSSPHARSLMPLSSVLWTKFALSQRRGDALPSSRQTFSISSSVSLAVLHLTAEKLVPIDPSKLQPPLFPRNLRDKKGTILTPRRDHLSGTTKFFNWVWEFGARLGQPDMRYAIKTGLGGAMLAAPAFLEQTRATFLEYRGEWALIAYFATLSPTVGMTNFLSFFRITGTMWVRSGSC